MIATRRRRNHFPVKRYLKLLVFGIVVYELYSVPLTHKFIFDGPLKPFWTQVGGMEKKFVEPYAGPVVAPLVKPFTFAAQQKSLMDDNKQLSQLKATVASDQADQQANMKKIADLQKKLDGKGDQQSAAAAGAASPTTSIATPLTPVTPSPDDVKTATYWSSMEPENAASIAQRLAPYETARVFLAMKPDQVAEIMNVLPTDYNVKLKAVHLDGSLSP